MYFVITIWCHFIIMCRLFCLILLLLLLSFTTVPMSLWPSKYVTTILTFYYFREVFCQTVKEIFDSYGDGILGHWRKDR